MTPQGKVFSQEIARELGFSSVNYFIRFFRKHTGTTPAALRREKFSAASKTFGN